MHLYFHDNRIGAVMVNVLATSAIDPEGLRPSRVKQKTILLVFVAFPLSTHQ